MKYIYTALIILLISILVVFNFAKNKPNLENQKIFVSKANMISNILSEVKAQIAPVTSNGTYSSLVLIDDFKIGDKQTRIIYSDPRYGAVCQNIRFVSEIDQMSPKHYSLAGSFYGEPAYMRMGAMEDYWFLVDGINGDFFENLNDKIVAFINIGDGQITTPDKFVIVKQ